MSADNGVYVLGSRTKDGGWEYRVCEASAIENVFWNYERKEEGSEFNMEEVRSYWGRSPIYRTQEEVMQEAVRILNDIEICEYGISFMYMDAEFNDKRAYVPQAEAPEPTAAPHVMHTEYDKLYAFRRANGPLVLSIDGSSDRDFVSILKECVRSLEKRMKPTSGHDTCSRCTVRDAVQNFASKIVNKVKNGEDLNIIREELVKWLAEN